MVYMKDGDFTAGGKLLVNEIGVCVAILHTKIKVRNWYEAMVISIRIEQLLEDLDNLASSWGPIIDFRKYWKNVPGIFRTILSWEEQAKHLLETDTANDTTAMVARLRTLAFGDEKK